MKPRPAALVLGASLVAAAAATAATARVDRPAPLLELEVLTNLLDGTEHPGCRAWVEPEAGKKRPAWVAFGAVAADAKDDWRAASARSDCGGGRLGDVGTLSRRTPGIPYVILDLEAELGGSGTERSAVSVTLHTRRLSGFDASGRPGYASVADRTVTVGVESDALLPLLIPDAREREAFGIHEVWLRLRVRGARPAAAYGAISVAADVPGAEILLDGGRVGRVSEPGPTILSNVLVGEREIAVRDFSGREARRRVTVDRGATAAVTLRVLSLPSAAPEAALLPIGKNPQGQEEYWRVKDATIVVEVPAGEFLMGSVEGQGEPHERPQHRVQVAEFLIDKLEVTWRQLRRYAEANGTPLPPAPTWGPQEDYAASNILWTEAQAYCEWVGGRLPTEAEWEKAARGPDGRLYPWGDDWDSERCNSWEGGPHRPRSAGSYTTCVSPYGVLEMPGGVWEWCGDWYGEGYYAESAPRDPTGPPAGSLRLLRGGSWLNQGLWLRPAYRHRNDPFSRNVHHGFRCVQGAAG